jgi:putative ATPase
MRPTSLEEVVGQDHLVRPGSPLRRLVEGGDEVARPVSVLLWGPPGTGKTTLAHLVAEESGRSFVEVSAVNAGVAQVRAVIDEARRGLAAGRSTVLFVDEVHRFSKTQQDALLPAVENGWVTLVAATTENPHFAVIAPLLSRSVLLTLRSLDDADVVALMRRALTDPRGLAEAGLDADDAVLAQVARMAAGDARWALTTLEAAAGAARSRGADAIALADVEQAVDRAAARYDRAGDQHYDITSALIKSVRGSDVDAALHYLARMVEAGEDPRFIARRLVILASEDIGLADPGALGVAVAAMQAVQLVGLPEGQLALAQAVIHLSLAPKSNAVTTAIGEASADVRRGIAGPVPAHLRDSHYPGARDLGHGGGYRYPHDDPRGVVEQDYAPDAVRGRDYYRPSGHGAERVLAERVQRLREAVRGASAHEGDA